MRADEARRLALGAEAEILDLHEADDGIVVIGLDEVDVFGPEPGLVVELARVERPAAAILDRIVREGVVPLDGGEDGGVGDAERPRAVLFHHQAGLGAGAGHDAVEQAERLGDRPRAQILLHGERALHHRVRDGERVLALGDAEPAEILAPGAELLHVVVGQEREARIGPAGAVGVDRVVGELAEAGDGAAE